MPAIYTRTGDKGDTGLFGGTRVAKQSLRVEAYGSVDEANAALGQAKASLPAGSWHDRVHVVQRRLFTVAAELASDEAGLAILSDLVSADDVTDLERIIDDCMVVTGPQRHFVISGRDERSAAFHLARTVLRRAERRVLVLSEHETVRPEVVTYLNRASDAVYALARLCETWCDYKRIERIVRRAVESALGMTGITRPVDLVTARVAAEAAERRASEVGVPIVFAAVDASGGLVLVHRMPDALLASTEIAVNKAWSAAAFKVSTSALAGMANGPLPGLADTNRGRVVLFGGGVPIFAGGALAGGFGVSGGTVEQDEDIVAHAQAACARDEEPRS